MHPTITQMLVVANQQEMERTLRGARRTEIGRRRHVLRRRHADHR